MNEVSSAFGTMEHETWTSLEEDAWKRMVGLFYIYKGNLVFSFTFTKRNIKDIHIHLHNLTLTLTRSYLPTLVSTYLYYSLGFDSPFTKQIIKFPSTKIDSFLYSRIHCGVEVLEY
jgi:hypothetical protein